ncbi:MAG: polymer-forming cytoskeletal protein [Candidatus Cloacimonetes bacterium]|nr:polymer-forming cytoskeletal protein [Candidatus Cloacimonadota bacterium]
MKKWIVCILFIVLSLSLYSIAEAENRDLIKIGSDLIVKKGMRVADAVAIGGDVTVNGMVEGDAVAVGGSVILGSDAIVEGDVVTIGGKIEKEEGAQINGDIVEVNIPFFSSIIPSVCTGRWFGWFLPLRIITFISFLVLALLIVAIIPKPVCTISTMVEKNTLKMILWGLLGLVLIVPLGILLAVSVVGIILIPIEIILVGCAFLVGYISVAQLIGDKIASALKSPDLHIIWETLLGMIILWVIGWIPFLGWLVKAIALLLGFGGVIVVLGRTSKSAKEKKVQEINE